MKNSEKYFDEELKLIQNVTLRDYVATFLDTVVPDYFWTVPASSSGKYHPSFSSGSGGLVKHTQMVVTVVIEMMRLDEYNCSDDISDSIIAACILHDTFKHGYDDYGHTVMTHPVIAAEEWAKFVGNKLGIYGGIYKLVYLGILTHMGQWGPEITKLIADSDMSDYVRVVHIADYIASRKFFDYFSNFEEL